MRTSKITIGRLFNLGSYEHIRYEVSVEISEGESARDAIVGLEKIMEALKPERSSGVDTVGEIERARAIVADDRKRLMDEGPDEFRRRHGHFVGTPEEYIDRCEQSVKEKEVKRYRYEKRSEKARQLLDNLGGASKLKDAKLDWENDDIDF